MVTKQQHTIYCYYSYRKWEYQNKTYPVLNVDMFLSADVPNNRLRQSANLLERNMLPGVQGEPDILSVEFATHCKYMYIIPQLSLPLPPFPLCLLSLYLSLFPSPFFSLCLSLSPQVLCLSVCLSLSFTLCLCLSLSLFHFKLFIYYYPSLNIIGKSKSCVIFVVLPLCLPSNARRLWLWQC